MFKYKTVKILNDINIQDGRIHSVDTQDVEVVDHDRYWGFQNYMKDEYKKFTADRKLDLTNVKTIFFTPKCDVSREKLRSLLDKHNMKVTRDSSKADVIITNAKYFADMIPFGSCNKIKGFDDVNIQSKAFVNPTDINNIMHCHVQDAIRNVMLVTLDRKYFSRNGWSDRFFDFSGSISIIKKSDLDNNELFQNIVNGTGNVYDQQVILDLMGESIIDRSAFEGLDAMLKSTDSSNHTVAMTIIANCNYQKSLIYILELCRRHNRTMWDNSVRKTVGFKGFINYMGGNMRYQLRMDYDDIFRTVLDKDAVTQDTIDFLYELGAEEFSASSDNITFTSYRFTDSAMKKLQSKLKTDDDGFPSGGEVLQQEVSVQLQQSEQTDVCTEHIL
jgi:hypothetical protein